jgi:hypothetical protein
VARLVRRHIEDERALTEHSKLRWAETLLEQRLQNAALTHRERRALVRIQSGSAEDKLTWLNTFLQDRAQALIATETEEPTP